MKSQTSMKMGHVGSKTRSMGQILKKPRVRSRGNIFSPIIMKLLTMFVLMKSRTSLKIGHVWSNESCQVKTTVIRSNIKKHCVRFRGNIFCLIILKRGQKVCLDKISDEFENGSCQVKN